ncbi:MAG: hypothetical protein E7588_04365 [Ruminococcaceae bacterium]|nr:hypothetical protein [Oscillospiraceae bacterium]
MAKIVRKINGDFYSILNTVVQGIQESSMSVTLEEMSDFSENGAKCSVRVFERYSYMGGNRVSMSITLFQSGNGPVNLCAVTSGGSQAVFFKINTIGEEAFLDKLAEILNREYPQ